MFSSDTRIKFLFVLSALAVLAGLGFIGGNGIYAGYEDYAGKIKYPVAELGGCRNAKECRTYCDRDENIPRCIKFSVKNGLISPEKAEKAEKLLARLDETGLPGKCRNAPECFAYCESMSSTKECLEYAERHGLIPDGETADTVRKFARLAEEGVAFPGNCSTRNECMAYCEDIAHIEECVAFAERSGVMDPEELAEAQRVRAAVRSGAKFPGECKNKVACEAYCESPAHMEECIAFAEKTGMISDEELAMAKKFMPAIKSGKTPGGCTRKAECEAYCDTVSHMDECLAFAEKHGLIPADELADAKRFVPYMKRGETPGGCTRRAECEAYCNDFAHFEECIAFAKKAGLMSEADAELARKSGGMGPGGCKSRDECEAFCRIPENRQTCTAFMKEHEFRGGGEIRDIEERLRGEVMETMRACAQKPCEELDSCLRSLQTGDAPDDDGGDDGMMPPEIKERILYCTQSRMQSCMSKTSCQDFIACLKGLESGERPDGEHEGEGMGLPSDVQSRLNSCVAEMRMRPGEGSFEGGTMPPSSGGEYEQIYQQEYQRQYEEQVRSQVNCSLFELAPTCDLAGPVGSETYNYCKMCFPNK